MTNNISSAIEQELNRSLFYSNGWLAEYLPVKNHINRIVWNIMLQTRNHFTDDLGL